MYIRHEFEFRWLWQWFRKDGEVYMICVATREEQMKLKYGN